jgi:hypothetical protein
VSYPTGIHYLRWTDVDPTARSCDAAPARAIAERFVDELSELLAESPAKPPVDAPDVRERAEDDLDSALIAAYGAWIAGWRWASSEPGGGGPVRAWCCAPHSLLPEVELDSGATEREAPDLSVLRVVAAVRDWRAFLERLNALFAELPEPRGESKARDVEHAAARILPFVVERTSTEDAWYSTFELVLEWFFESKGQAVEPYVHEVIGGRFHSWTQPAPEIAAAVCRDLGNRFGEERPPVPATDATAEWLAIRGTAFDLFTPRVERPLSEDDAHRRFIDGPERARDPVRAECMRTALELARTWADSPLPLGFDVVAAWAGAIHGTTALSFRDADALAKKGREIYPLAGARALFERALAEAEDERVPVAIRAARLFLDICFVHPFADGNARLARLAVDALLWRAGLALAAVEPLVILSRAANDRGGAWYCAHLVDRLSCDRAMTGS